MGQVDGARRIRDVDDRRAVGFDGAGQRVQALPRVMADVGDAAFPLPDGQGLVGGARLQVVHADEPGVEGFLAVACLLGLGWRVIGGGDGEHEHGGDRQGDPAVHREPPVQWVVRSGYPKALRAVAAHFPRA